MTGDRLYRTVPRPGWFRSVVVDEAAPEVGVGKIGQAIDEARDHLGVER